MRAAILIAFVFGASVGTIATMFPKIAAHVHAPLQGGAAHSAEGGAITTLVHTEKHFEFLANAPMNVVAPLFGAWKEREWAPDWNPKFVWPAPPESQSVAQPGADAATRSANPTSAQPAAGAIDRLGMVFTVKHGHAHAAWVNTEFDLAAGRIQYAYMVPDAMVTLITLQLTPEGNRTHVTVEYDRTALDAQLNAHVEQMADADGKAGPEWEQQIDEYLEKTKR